MLSQEAIQKIQRLSIERCRELLGEDGKTLSDQQIEELRDDLYILVDSTLDNLFNPSNVCRDHE